MSVCRVCGCTDEEACVWSEVLPGAGAVELRCSWVEPDLCSECVDAGDVEPAAPLLYDAFGRPLAPLAPPGAR